jgi:hypothetical protein
MRSLGYHRPRLGVRNRYLMILLTALKCQSLGVHWNLAHIHTLSMISGLDAQRKSKDQIME